MIVIVMGWVFGWLTLRVCRSQCSFVLGSLGSFFLLGVLGLGDDCSLFDGLGDGGVEGLPAVGLNGTDAAIFNALAEEDAGDGADDFELFDEGGGGDVFSEFGDAGDDAFVGGLIKEDSVIGFLFNFSLGPFLQ